MKNMKTVRAKILSGFILILAIGVILGISGIVSIMYITVMSSELDEIYNVSANISNVLDSHYNWKQALTEAVLNGTEFTGELDPKMCALGKFIAGPEAKGINNPEIINMLAQIKDPHDYIHTHAKAIQTLIEAGNLNEARIYLNDNIIPETDETMTILRDMDNRYIELSEKQTQKILDFETLMIIIIAILIVAAIISGIIISMVITAGIEKNLKNIIEKLNYSSSNIKASARQLSEASDNLAEGASKQAAAIEQTSATMNETSSMISQNAENTRQATQIATKVTQSVTESGNYMSELMHSMNKLKESSDRVSKITKTISGLSSQTNLLALNASVESVRAGEAGKAFSVVSEEVRALALESAGASSDTANIIKNNIELTDMIKKDAEKVLDIAQKNANDVANLDKLISEISAASEEQAGGIKQINVSVSEMEKVTQENAAVAEETSASANSMKDESDNLEELVLEALRMISQSP